MKKTEGTPQYGNWVPEKLLILLWSLFGICLVLLAASVIWWDNIILIAVFLVAAAVLGFYAGYMQLFHQSFSFAGGGLMGKIHQYLLTKLDWDGNGTLLDVGCGSGALTIRCAKGFPKAKIIGLDYWGVQWNYAQSQCQENARLEQVENTEFIKGDAAKLPFEDGSVDAVVSNFVFHEVRTVKDKRSLVRESLRVLKPGGSFAFHDMFEQKHLYGNMDDFVAQLKEAGITEIHYKSHTENLPFVPGAIKLMFRDMGLLYGKK